MPPKASIFPATPQHLWRMKAVNELMLPENYDAQMWLRYLKQRRSFVAMVGEEVVGYCLCSEEGMILSLAVRTDYQRQGLARGLMTRVIALYPQQVYTLNARVSNIGAIALYKSLGFETIKCIVGYYYHEGEDGLEMVRV